MTPFDVANPETWPMVLALEQVAAIYSTTPKALQARLKPSSKGIFPLKPFMRYPSRWRKVDVLRHIEGARRVA